MNTYRRLFAYASPYWKRGIVLFLIITVFASLNGVSLTLIPPFLKILLGGDEVAVTEPNPDVSVGRVCRFRRPSQGSRLACSIAGSRSCIGAVRGIGWNVSARCW